jgi:hypothetical protein
MCLLTDTELQLAAIESRLREVENATAPNNFIFFSFACMFVCKLTDVESQLAATTKPITNPSQTHHKHTTLFEI